LTEQRRERIGKWALQDTEDATFEEVARQLIEVGVYNGPFTGKSDVSATLKDTASKTPENDLKVSSLELEQ
jgi:hypothetical protein